jgi:hypothetical protein
VDGICSIRVIDESNDSLSALVHHERRTGGHPIVANESSLAQIGIYLCLEGLDVDFVVVDLGSVGKLESRLGLFDGGNRHFELI